MFLETGASCLGETLGRLCPLKKNGTKNDIISSSISESYLWRYFKVFVLAENMRLKLCTGSVEERQQIAEFSKWLLDVGDGKAGVSDVDDPENSSWIRIPDKHCFEANEEGKWQLIDFIYDRETLMHPTAESLQDKAIVCPRNETADAINAEVLATLEGVSHFYSSVDQAIPRGNDGGATELLYPGEYLNTLSFPSLPPHTLELKVGTPIMLLRNLNLIGGLCNGTRMIVSQLLTKVIEAKIITGTRVAQKVFIPRIILTASDDRLPFIFKRKQFLAKVCYAMTINKSQGQSLKKIGVYLPEPIFGHGQLYVALSRATSSDGLRMVIAEQPEQPPNTTKNIVYKDLLNKLSVTQVYFALCLDDDVSTVFLFQSHYRGHCLGT